jgi:hypothetical protein
MTTITWPVLADAALTLLGVLFVGLAIMHLRASSRTSGIKQENHELLGFGFGGLGLVLMVLGALAEVV